MMAFTLNVLYYILDVKLEYALQTYIYSYKKIDKPVSAPHVTIKKYYDGNVRIYGYNT